MSNQSLVHILPRVQRLLGENHGPSDAQLLERFLSHGDAEAFRELMRRHGPMVLGACRRLLPDAHDVDDVFQATFLVLMRKASSIGRREQLASWLYGVAHRTALKVRTQNACRHRREQSLADIPVTGEVADLVWSELRPLLDEELHRLPEKYRAPVVLCYLEGISKREAARQLGWPEGTLSVRLHRARELLRRRLTRRGVTLSMGIIAVALSQGGAPAAVPGSLLAATVGIAFSAIQGRAATMPARITALADAVTAAWWRGRRVVVLVLATTLLTVGVVAATQMFPRPPVSDAGKAATVNRPDEDAKPSVQRPRAMQLDPKVRRVIWSADGKLLASEAMRYQKVPGTGNGPGQAPAYEKYATMKVWDALTGKEICTLGESKVDTEAVKKPGPAFFDFAFAPDGSLLAVSYRDLTGEIGNKIELWDPRLGKRVRTIETQDTWQLPRIMFSPDGKSLAVLIHGGYAEDDPTPGIARTYDVATGKTIQTIRSRLGAARLVFSPDGRLLATFGYGNASQLSLWNVKTGKREEGVPGNVEVAAFSPDGKILATSNNANVMFWDITRGTSIRDFTAPGIPAVLAFSPDGRFLAGAGHRSISEEAIDETWLWDARMGESLHVDPKQGNRPAGGVLRAGQLLRTWTKTSLSLAFMPDGKTLGVLTSEGFVRLLDLPEAAPTTNKLQQIDSHFAKLINEITATRRSDDQAADALFLAVLGRFPEDAERKRAVEQLTGKTDRRAALVELARSLINSKEYLNHVQALNQLVPQK